MSEGEQPPPPANDAPPAAPEAPAAAPEPPPAAPQEIPQISEPKPTTPAPATGTPAPPAEGEPAPQSQREGPKSAKSTKSAASGAGSGTTLSPKASPERSASGRAASGRQAASGKASKQGSTVGKPKSAASGKSSTAGTQRGRRDGSGPSSVVNTDRQTTVISETLPEGCVPLFISAKTQEIFSLRVENDITRDSPLKLIKKEDIVMDMKARAAVSDFSEIKQHVLNYPGEEMLIVYDYEFKYGQNFFAAITEEAKELILNPPKTTPDPEPVMDYKYVPPVSKPWVSLGSEKEIDTARLLTNRPLLTMSIVRKRSAFGHAVELGDRGVGDAKDSYVEIKPSTEERPFDVKVVERDSGIQAVRGLIDVGTQTTWRYPRTNWVQCEFREWDAEHRDQALHSEEMATFATGMETRFHCGLQQNEINNVFINDWDLLAEDDDILSGKSDTHLKEYQSFTEIEYSKEKQVTHIEWHPSLRGVLACSVGERCSFDDRIERAAQLVLHPSLIIIWSFTDPIHPQLLLQAPDDVLCFQFCPTNPNIIAAGCSNGQLVLWDITEHAERLRATRPPPKKKTTLHSMPGFDEEGVEATPMMRYCAVSSIEHGHHSPITDILWLPDHFEINRMGVPIENRALTSCQIVTSAADQTLLVWDIRPQKGGERLLMKDQPLPMGIPATFRHLDLIWRPFLKVQLFKSEPGGDHNPTKFSISERQGDRSILNDKDDSKETDTTMTMGGGFVAGPGKQKEKERSLTHLRTHFYVGSEDGEIIYVDWMPQKDQDTGKIQTPKPVFYCALHDGPIVTLVRSPFFKDVLLAVGGWRFSIWKEGENSGPIVCSSTQSRRLSCGCWSPSRPSVFFIAGVDGSVDVWDLTDRTHEPSFTQHVTPAAIITLNPIQVSKKQQLMAIGDVEGTLHVLEVPGGLRQPVGTGSASELHFMTHYVTVETKRRQFLVARLNVREQERIEAEIEEKRKAGIATAVVLSEEEIEMKMKLEYQTYLHEEAEYLRKGGFSREEVDEIIAHHRSNLDAGITNPDPPKKEGEEEVGENED